jgi:enamine deaminase RidA (YjgF/YER057c/UK114 family)
MRTLLPPGWPRPKGYSNGVEAEGRLVFVAGQVAWDSQERIVGGDLAAQVGQALKNIVAVLAVAGAAPSHIVRMTWFVTDKREYQGALQAIGEQYRAVIGLHYPAMSVVAVTGLVEDGARVEIEATAVVPHSG